MVNWAHELGIDLFLLEQEHPATPAQGRLRREHEAKAEFYWVCRWRLEREEIVGVYDAKLFGVSNLDPARDRRRRKTKVRKPNPPLVKVGNRYFSERRVALALGITGEQKP